MQKRMFDVEQSQEDSKYTLKVEVPQYLPSAVCPDLSELLDTTKYYQLLHDIEKSNVSEQEKQFLRLSATRLIGFNFSLIADYYSHADKEMQELMEKQALVIIDIEDAIANGYVEYSKTMDSLLRKQLEKNNG
jgi:hypothetical protein